MKAEYTVHYSGVIDIDNSEWDDLKEYYDNDLSEFIFVTVQESLGVWEGITIDNVKDKP